MSERRVIGYLRVSTRERRSTRPSRTTQQHEIELECARRGWSVVRFEDDVRSGRSLRRPGLHAALEGCRAGAADVLMVARLDRLTISVEDLAYLVHRAVDDRFTIVAPDLDLDLEAESGAQLARVLSAAASWHQRGVARRTLQPAGWRAEGEGRGRPSSTPTSVADRIRAMRESGATLQAICDVLNEEGVPTPRGGTHWRPTSLRAIVRPQAGSGPPRTKDLVSR